MERSSSNHGYHKAVKLGRVHLKPHNSSSGEFHVSGSHDLMKGDLTDEVISCASTGVLLPVYLLGGGTMLSRKSRATSSASSVGGSPPRAS